MKIIFVRVLPFYSLGYLFFFFSVFFFQGLFYPDVVEEVSFDRNKTCSLELVYSSFQFLFNKNIL